MRAALAVAVALSGGGTVSALAPHIVHVSTRWPRRLPSEWQSRESECRRLCRPRRAADCETEPD
jgi:hypothetical protein